MPLIRHRYDPDAISDQVLGKYPLKHVRDCIRELYGLVGAASTVSGSSGGAGSPGSTGPPGPAGTTLIDVIWRANGPYRVGTEIDGAWIVKTACAITQLYLWRGTAGRSGQTVVDLKRRHSGETSSSSLYATTANRPTLAYDDTDGLIACNLPDDVALVPGDIVTIDCLDRDVGRPRHFTLSLGAAA